MLRLAVEVISPLAAVYFVGWHLPSTISIKFEVPVFTHFRDRRGVSNVKIRLCDPHHAPFSSNLYSLKI